LWNVSGWMPWVWARRRQRPRLVTANGGSDDVSVLLNQCDPAVRAEIDSKPGSDLNRIQG
jgi:hypothetical protein